MLAPDAPSDSWCDGFYDNGMPNHQDCRLRTQLRAFGRQPHQSSLLANVQLEVPNHHQSPSLETHGHANELDGWSSLDYPPEYARGHSCELPSDQSQEMHGY